MTRHQFAHLVQGIAVCFESLFVSVLDDSNLTPMALQDHARVHTHKRKASRDIVLFGRLKKETVTTAVQLLESRNRRFSVRNELCENRNDVASVRELNEFTQSRSDLRSHLTYSHLYVRCLSLRKGEGRVRVCSSNW